MLKTERQHQILQRLQTDGIVRVSELAGTLTVDPVTIRRDLADLEGQGRLARTHGGALLRETLGPADLPSDLQRRIAEAGARFIPDQSVVFIGPGKLTQEIVAYLKDSAQLTLVTNALNVAWSIARQQRHTLHVVGGQVAEDHGMYGDSDALATIRADWVILEAQALDAERGLTDDDRDYAAVARHLFQIGAQVMLLVEPERLGRTRALSIAPASEVDVLITGREAGNLPLWDLSELGIRVVLA